MRMARSLTAVFSKHSAATTTVVPSSSPSVCATGALVALALITSLVNGCSSCKKDSDNDVQTNNLGDRGANATPAERHGERRARRAGRAGT